MVHLFELRPFVSTVKVLSVRLNYSDQQDPLTFSGNSHEEAAGLPLAAASLQ